MTSTRDARDPRAGVAIFRRQNRPTRRDRRRTAYLLPTLSLGIQTHLSPFHPNRPGYHSDMTLQSFLHKELAYSGLDLCIEIHLSPLLLIRADSACYMSLPSFPHKDLAYSILVWLAGLLFLSCPPPSGCRHSGSCRSGTHGLHRQRTVTIPAQRRLRVEQNSCT